MTAPDSPSLGWVLLYVDDVAISTRFYTEALGLRVRFADDSGSYTELDTGPTALALCARSLASASAGLDLDHSGGPTGNVTLVVDDVPGAWQRALAGGAEAVLAPTRKPWGQTSSYVRDADGHLIEIASPVEG